MLEYVPGDNDVGQARASVSARVDDESSRRLLLVSAAVHLELCTKER